MEDQCVHWYVHIKCRRKKDQGFENNKATLRHYWVVSTKVQLKERFQKNGFAPQNKACYNAPQNVINSFNMKIQF